MKSRYELYWIIVLVVISLVIIGCFRQAPQCRQVQILYEDTEYYTETESYTDKICIPQYMDGEIGKFYDLAGEERETTKTLTVVEDYTKNLEIKYYVENFENRAGRFEVYVSFLKEESPGSYTLSGDKPILVDSFNINANSRKIAYFYMNSIWDDIPYGADAIMLDEDGEEYEDCKESVKYEDIQKSRPVMKYKTDVICE